MSQWEQGPSLSVRLRQFTEHHSLTAHNTYVLAAAELGLPGMFLWSTVFYISLKIPVSALSRFQSPESAVARTWAMAMVAALTGLAVGVFFLSFCYHYVLWIYFGLSGAFYAAARTHDPEWKVEYQWKD